MSVNAIQGEKKKLWAGDKTTKDRFKFYWENLLVYVPLIMIIISVLECVNTELQAIFTFTTHSCSLFLLISVCLDAAYNIFIHSFVI